MGIKIRLFGLLEFQIINISINITLTVYHSYCYTFCCYFLFYEITHCTLMLMLTSFLSEIFRRHLDVILTPGGGVSRMLSASRMELFVTLISGFLLLTNITVTSVLFVKGVLHKHQSKMHHCLLTQSRLIHR